MSESTGPLRAYKKPGRPPCDLAGCDQPLYARGLCVMHYNRLRKRGEVGGPGRERDPLGSGHVNEYGYRIIKAHGHPVATSQGKAYEHRVVLYEKLGQGPHPCHWCGKRMPWKGGAAVAINVDHLDGDRLNNSPDNLVASCLDCNTKRGAQNGAQVLAG